MYNNRSVIDQLIGAQSLLALSECATSVADTNRNELMSVNASSVPSIPVEWLTFRYFLVPCKPLHSLPLICSSCQGQCG